LVYNGSKKLKLAERHLERNLVSYSFMHLKILKTCAQLL